LTDFCLHDARWWEFGLRGSGLLVCSVHCAQTHPVDSTTTGKMTDKINMGGSLLTIEQWEQVAREADFNPSKMASLCSLSERQLQRLFRKHLHCTPSHWLRELQCRLAKQLISQGYSNKAAAIEVRFATESHLCREFKKIFGTSPQSFAPSRAGNLKTSPVHRISKKSWHALRNPIPNEG
jgi:AraC-like DNA-binding protein